jgi:UDP-N-acetylglucosamine diphosphorylase/glucosamine-1-phosphate N-acetyltransferase
MNLILFDDPTVRQDLLPFTFTRPVAALRVGICTIAEKWAHALGQRPSYATQPHLSEKFPIVCTTDNLWVHGAVCPDAALVAEIRSLTPGEGLRQGSALLAYRTPEAEIPEVIGGAVRGYEAEVILVDQLWKIFQYNGWQIRADFGWLTAGRTSQPVEDEHTRVYARDQIFLEPGVNIRAAILNAEQGPIYIGKNAIIQEGAIIRGPFAMGEGSHINMGAKIRGDVSLGPFCKVGGEVSNSVFIGYSSKAHDGFLGNSVIGEWCNFGADSNTSNLKNNYDNIKIWSYRKGAFADTGLMFCGLMMGDHSKCGINTMFNTGTVVGVSANVFGGGFPRTFIPSFAWGGAAGFTTFQLPKALDTAAKAMARRNETLDPAARAILEYHFNESARERVWETK